MYGEVVCVGRVEYSKPPRTPRPNQHFQPEGTSFGRVLYTRLLPGEINLIEYSLRNVSFLSSWEASLDINTRVSGLELADVRGL